MNNLENKIDNIKHIFDEHISSSYLIKPGKGSIMISAPHSVSQTREGRFKCAETQTGYLSELLNQELNCPVIYKTRNCNDDANYDSESTFRNEIEHYVKSNDIAVLIDLHQLKPERDVMINIGTGKFKNINNIDLFNIILFAFSKNTVGGIKIDDPFAATYENTVSRSISQKCGIQCVQLEINSRLLFPKYNEFNFKGIFNSLCEIVYNINNFKE